MKGIIKKYSFHKVKYGDELLIDVVQLKDIKQYLTENPVHSLNYYDITLITEGKGAFSIDNCIYEVQAGDIIVSSPDQIRKWDTENIINGYALIFDEDFLLSFFNDQNFLKDLSFYSLLDDQYKLSLTEDEKILFMSLLFQIEKEIRLYKEMDKHILRALLYQSLKQLDRIYRFRNDKFENKEYKASYLREFEMLVNKLYSQHHSIKFYADSLCITSNYLNELVKKSTGYNAKKMINEKIIREAKKKLLYTSITITELAFELGFEDVSYFIRFFRKDTGKTPLVYRNTEQP